MICATCCNCWPMLVLGNCVCSAVDLASAAESALASLMLLASTLSAACTKVMPLPSAMSPLSAFHRACEAAELLKPDNCNDCPGESATGCVDAPVPSNELPATEKKVGNFEEFIPDCAI